MTENVTMRKWLVGTRVGRVASAFRDTTKLIRAAATSIETLGSYATDMVAARLTTGLLPPGQTFVDVGAHIGSVFAEVLRRDPTAHVVAFEATPEKAAWLRRRFPRAEVHSCALADAPGQMTFFIQPAAGGYNSLVRPLDSKRFTEITVDVKRLDDIAIRGEIGVMKVDVEGAELQVLEGARETITLNRPTIVFESAATTGVDSSAARLGAWRLLDGLGYQILVPTRVASAGAAGLTEEAFADAHVYPRRATNFFAVPSERRDEVRARARRVLDGLRGPARE
jgi:FkbM family methyltransferase